MKLLRTWGRSWSGSAGIPNRSSESLSKARNAQREFWPLVPCSLLTLPRCKTEAITTQRLSGHLVWAKGMDRLPPHASSQCLQATLQKDPRIVQWYLILIYNELLNHPLCSVNFILWIHDMITWRPLTWSEPYVTPSVWHSIPQKTTWNKGEVPGTQKIHNFLVSNLLMNWVSQEPWNQRVVLICNLTVITQSQRKMWVWS